MPKSSGNFSTLILLVLIAVVGVFTLDVYLPGMPAMADQLHVSMKEIAYTFTGFSIVFAISQLLHGVFSDYLGRKKVLISGLSIAAFATILCMYAQSYKLLFAARLLQAVGISSFVVVNAIIRDLYTGSKAVQVRTIVATASGISISVAPTIGGFLQERFSWQGGFAASLLLIVVAIIYALMFYTESCSIKSSVKIRVKSLARSYLSLYFDQDYLSHVLITMLAYTVHFTFIILSSDIFIKILGASPFTFGCLMIVYGGIYFLGGLYAGWQAKRMSLSGLIQRGGFIILSGGVLTLLFLLWMEIGVVQILLPVGIITIGVTMVRAAAISSALAPLPDRAGQAAAGLNLIQFALSAVLASAITTASNEPQLSIGVLAVSSAILIEYLRRRVAV